MDLNNEIKQEKVNDLKYMFRVDDAKKHYKVAISQFATEKINKLIKNSDLPKRFKKKNSSSSL